MSSSSRRYGEGKLRKGERNKKAPNSKTQMPSYSVKVNDTKPIFYYCNAPGSCYQHQMIGVINANADQTFDVQMAYAKNATTQLSPGERFPSETESASSSSTPTGSTAQSSSTAGASATDTGGGSGLGAGAIAGIVIGSIAGLVLIGCIIYLCGRRGGLATAYRHSRAPTFAQDSAGGPGAMNGGGGMGANGMDMSMANAQHMSYAGPKSPGMSTFLQQYSPTPDTVEFRSATQSPQYPPLSPNSYQASLATYPGVVPGQGVHNQVIGEMPAYHDHGAYL
jgi:hypothetical protein